MKHLSRLATQVFGTPLAIHPPKLDAILAAIGSRFGLESTEAAGMDLQPMDRKSYDVTREGVACIPVQGTLMKKAYGMWAYSGCTSYEMIGEQVEDAATDPSVKAILLDIDSPGGSTHGCFELSDLIYSLRGDKPIFAVANDCALSAAYAIASAADKVFVTRTGAVGSIGVFALHVDQSGADEQVGLKYTYVYAGDKKIEGNPHEPLTRGAKKDTQEEVDREYEMFLSAVARNRKAKVDDIRGTQASSIFAEKSVPLLADKVGTCADAMSELLTSISGSSRMFAATQPRAEQIPPVTEAAMAVEQGADMTAEELAIAAKAEDAKKADDYKMEEDAKKSKAKKSTVDEEDQQEGDEPDDKKAAKAISDAKTAGAADAKQVANLCKLAGKPELAAEYIVAGLSAAKVQEKLLELRSAKSEASGHVNSNYGAVTVGALDTIEQQASAMAANSGGTLTKAAAYGKLLMANPRLYQQYEEEREIAMASPSARRQYLAMLEAKMPTFGLSASRGQ